MTHTHQHLDWLLEQCLEQLLGHNETIESILDSYPEDASELRPKLEAAAWLLAQQNRLNPRAGFIEASRRHFVKQLQEAGYQVQSSLFQQVQVFLKSKRAIQLAVVVLLITILLTGNTVAMASRSAIPGDSTYPVKLTMEKAQLTVSLDDKDNLLLQLDFTQRRLAELEWLILEGRYEFALEAAMGFEYQLQRTVQLLNASANQDSEQAQLLSFSLESNLASQRPVLNVLIPMIPDPTRGEVQQVIDLAFIDLGGLEH